MLLGLIAAVLVALLVRSTLVTFYTIPSESMEPTLLPGDTIVVRRFPIHRLPEAARGDVVVFRLPQSDRTYYVKRVVAIPGDYVEMVDGELRINGEAIAEPYVAWRDQSTVAAQIVPAGMVFVLGDRRAGSVDSRTWGPLPARLLIGRAWRIFWSLERGGGEQKLRRVRFGRIGHAIR